MQPARLINAMLARLGLRVLRTERVFELQEGIKSLETIIVAQGGQLRTLTQALTDATALNAQLDDLRKEADYLRSRELASRQQAERLVQQINETRSGLSSRLLLAPDQRRNIVIVATTVSQVPQLKAFADSAEMRDAYRLTIVSYFDVAATDLLQFCTDRGISLLNYKGDVLSGTDDVAALLAASEMQLAFGLNASLGDYQAEEKQLLEHTRLLLSEIHWQNGLAMLAHRLLRLLRANVVVMFEDNAEYNTGMWVAVARNAGVPVVIFPYAIIDSGDAAEAHYNDPAYAVAASALNRFVAASLPQWAFLYRDRQLLRRSAQGLLTSEVLGFAQPKPWVWNSTRANVLAVESEAMREVYLAQGLPEPQIEVTGSISDDLLRNAMRNTDQIRQSLGLDSRLRTLVCAFPPDQFNVGRSEPEFDDFRTIVDRWLGEFSQLQGWQVVIKPHPSMKPQDVEYLRSFRYPVTDVDTTSLVAICDLFNTSVSSTIRWALACGKPAINYDVYRYRYQDFVKEPAVLTVFDIDDFSRELHRLTGDAAELQGMTEVARASSSRWGILDGESAQRIVKLLDRLTGRQDPSLVAYQQARS